MPGEIRLSVNGRPYSFQIGTEVPESETLVETIRERLHLTGTKRPCNEGGCGGCTVLVDGRPTLSCSTLTAECDGRSITTIEGLEDPVTHELHPIQQAFIDLDAIQCGMCTPGITLTAKALLDRNPDPTRQEVAEALAGNICRCTGYEKYFDGILLAARRMRETADAMIREFGGDTDKTPKEGFLKAGSHCLDHTPQLETPHVPAAERTIDKEDEATCGLEEIQTEANRCFNCSCYAVTPSDVATALMAARAKVVTNKAVYDADEFFTTNVSVQDFLGADEIVTAVEVPAAAGVSAYDKFRERESIDFAVVGLGSNYEVKDGVIEKASIVLGAVAPVPVRAERAEEFLKGKAVSEEVAAQAAEIALADADPLEQTEYKVDIAKTLIRRSIMKLA